MCCNNFSTKTDSTETLTRFKLDQKFVFPTIRTSNGSMQLQFCSCMFERSFHLATSATTSYSTALHLIRVLGSTFNCKTRRNEWTSKSKLRAVSKLHPVGVSFRLHSAGLVEWNTLLSEFQFEKLNIRSSSPV